MKNVFGWVGLSVFFFACSGRGIIDGLGGSGGESGGSSSTVTATSSGSSASSVVSSSVSASTTTSASSGMIPMTCTGLAFDYEQTLEQAKSCDASVGAKLCSAQAPDRLHCPCPTLVNPENTNALDHLAALRDQWEVLSCGSSGRCPMNACPDLDEGVVCSATPNGGSPGNCFP